MNLLDIFYKKTINFHHNKRNLKFMVSQNLFSSQKIDAGSQRLIRSLVCQNVGSFKKALDLGCGYGPLGIFLKLSCPMAEVHMTDVDALAIEFSKKNAVLNKVGKIHAYASLGYDDVLENDFDLIVSNIPAKIGPVALNHLILESKDYLSKDGMVVVVVVEAIQDFVHQTLLTDKNINILFHQSWKGHRVYHFSFSGINDKKNQLKSEAFNSGKYFRGKSKIKFMDFEIDLQPSYNLPEFESLSYDSQILLTHLSKIKGFPQKVLCFNPGQGFIPAVLAKNFSISELYLVGRDLLELRTSQNNLIKSGFSSKRIRLKHQVNLRVKSNKLDLIIGVISTKQPPDFYRLIVEELKVLLRPGSKAFFSSSSTTISRFQNLLDRSRSFKVLFRDKKRGRSVLLIKRRSK